MSLHRPPGSGHGEQPFRSSESGIEHSQQICDHISQLHELGVRSLDDLAATYRRGDASAVKWTLATTVRSGTREVYKETQFPPPMLASQSRRRCAAYPGVARDRTTPDRFREFQGRIPVLFDFSYGQGGRGGGKAISLVHPVDYLHSHFCLDLPQRRRYDLLYTHQLFHDGVPVRYAMDIDDDQHEGMTAALFAQLTRASITAVADALVESGGLSHEQVNLALHFCGVFLSERPTGTEKHSAHVIFLAHLVFPSLSAVRAWHAQFLRARLAASLTPIIEAGMEITHNDAVRLSDKIVDKGIYNDGSSLRNIGCAKRPCREVEQTLGSAATADEIRSKMRFLRDVPDRDLSGPGALAFWPSGSSSSPERPPAYRDMFSPELDGKLRTVLTVIPAEEAEEGAMFNPNMLDQSLAAKWGRATGLEVRENVKTAENLFESHLRPLLREMRGTDIVQGRVAPRGGVRIGVTVPASKRALPGVWAGHGVDGSSWHARLTAWRGVIRRESRVQRQAQMDEYVGGGRRDVHQPEMRVKTEDSVDPEGFKMVRLTVALGDGRVVTLAFWEFVKDKTTGPKS